MHGLKQESKIFYGWRIAVATWMVYFLSTAPCTYGYSVISTKLVLEEGWSEGIIGLASSGNSLVLAIACIPGSILIRKKNVRFTITVGTLVGAFAYSLLWLLPESELSYVLLISLSGLTTSLCGFLVGPALINAWFDRNRTLPMAFVMSAGGVGGFLMPVIARYLASISIKICWILYLSMMILALILGHLYILDDPEKVNEVKDGKEWVKSHPLTSKDREHARSLEVMTLKQCYASPQFWMMSCQTFCIRMIWGSFMSYAMYYAIQKGGTTAFAAALLSAANMSGFTFRCLSGLSGRIPLSKNMMIAVCLLSLGLGNLLMVISPSMTVFMVGAILVGGGYGFLVVYFPLLVTDSFGSSNFVMLNGTFNTINCAGLAVGPIIAFTVAKIFGGYHSSFLLAFALMILCAMMAVFMSRQRARVNS